MAVVGYSGTPLPKKLGLRNGIKVGLMNQPEYYFELFSDLSLDIEIVSDIRVKKNIVHYFVKSADQLQHDILWLKAQIEEDGVI